MKAETLRALKNARDLAMKNTLAARIPECGDFGHIAQDLDYVLNDIEAYTAPPREVVYLIYHGDGECAVDEVSKADYDEHEGPKRILYTAPPREVDDLMPLIKRMNSYLIMSGIQGNKDSDNPIEFLKYDLLKAIKNER
jgi:hypothetical protein